MTYFDAVGAFRSKMGLPMSIDPHLLPASEASYFARFIMEELSEYLRACEENSLVDAADAVIDLVYVALGCAHAMGIPFDELFGVVHRANMAKEPANEYWPVRDEIKSYIWNIAKMAGVKSNFAIYP